MDSHSDLIPGESDNISVFKIFKHMYKNKTYLYLALSLSTTYYMSTNI